MGRPDVPESAPFRISSYSGGGGCVEVARLADGRAVVRDSKDRRPRPPLLFVGRNQWTAFLGGLRGDDGSRP